MFKSGWNYFKFAKVKFIIKLKLKKEIIIKIYTFIIYKGAKKTDSPLFLKGKTSGVALGHIYSYSLLCAFVVDTRNTFPSD